MSATQLCAVLAAIYLAPSMSNKMRDSMGLASVAAGVIFGILEIMK